MSVFIFACHSRLRPTLTMIQDLVSLAIIVKRLLSDVRNIESHVQKFENLYEKMVFFRLYLSPPCYR